MSSIVTLTTDFGARDGYVAQMKGVILTINPQAPIVDVTHDIRPFSILEGALVLKGVSRYFPAGTIHVGVIDPGVGSARRSMVLRSGRQFFVGPDNGLFSLILRTSDSWQAREIATDELILDSPHPTFHGRDIFAPLAAHLSLGTELTAVGPLIENPVMLPIPGAIRTDDGLQGRVIHIDRFGNLTTNIEGSALKRPVAMVLIRDIEIRRIGRFFADAAEGEPLALINSFGYLEIAVNRGNASSELGVGIGAEMRLTWAAP